MNISKFLTFFTERFRSSSYQHFSQAGDRVDLDLSDLQVMNHWPRYWKARPNGRR